MGFVFSNHLEIFLLYFLFSHENMCDMENIIEQYRKCNRLTYSQMAELAGFSSRSVVFLHCIGKRSVSAESAIRYETAFNIPRSALRPDLWPPPTPPATSPEPAQAAHP